MNIETRKNIILQMLAQKSSVTVLELSEKFGLSEVSIRRLLVAMENEGSITRTWGGAVSTQSSLSEFSHEKKEMLNLPQKQAIALAAYERIVDGDALFLDSGTTTLALARLIAQGEKRHVMVVTNALNIALEFRNAEDIHVMLIGGEFRHKILCCTGLFAMDSLKQLFFDKGFATGNHFTDERGFTTPSLQEAEMKRKVLSISKESYILMDASKYGNDSLTLIAPCEEVDYLITDSRLPQEAIRRIAERGIEVIAAPDPAS